MLMISNKSGIDYYSSSTNNLFEDVYKFKTNKIFEDMDIFIKEMNNEDISKLSEVMYLDFKMIFTKVLLKKMTLKKHF